MALAAVWQQQQLGGCLAAVADAGVAAGRRWQSGGGRAAAPDAKQRQRGQGGAGDLYNFCFLAAARQSRGGRAVAPAAKQQLPPLLPPLCHHRSTIQEYKFNVVKCGMTDSV